MPAVEVGGYEAEVTQARDQVRRLRNRFVERCVERLQSATMGRTGGGGLHARPDQQLLLDDSKTGAESVLGKLVATCLLDASTTLPIDVETLHKRILRGPAGEKYERTLTAMGLTNLEPLILKYGGPELRLMEVLQLDVNANAKMFITNMDRMALAGHTGVEPPPMMFRPPPAMEPGVMMMPQPGMMGVPPPRPPPPLSDGFGMMPPPGSMGMPGALGAPAPFMPRPMQPPPPAGGPGMPSIMGPNGMAPMPPPGMMPPIMGPGGQGVANAPVGPPSDAAGPDSSKRSRPEEDELDLESILNRRSARDKVQTERGEELLDILAKPTAKESANLEKFRSVGGSAVREHCPHLTKEDCRRAHNSPVACHRVHFRKLIYPWTDVSLGNCSYLDTCRNMRNCKYIHYELDTLPDMPGGGGHMPHVVTKTMVPRYLQALEEPQWVKCDVRSFNMEVLGKFGVIMADPPWEIHQDLPYGTMADDEMRNMQIGCLQDQGVIFLWVTGRAMELGRECLAIWGYERVDELIWVKTNQLQRLIRTGRTGHWLNHSKEHCLVGYKGNPQLNRFVDCDVVVAEVRETSRKPDEMYPLLERLSPGTRKLEIFARNHNLRPGWVGLGNQLNGVQIKDPEMRARYKAVYGEPEEPDAKFMPGTFINPV